VTDFRGTTTWGGGYKVYKGARKFLGRLALARNAGPYPNGDFGQGRRGDTETR